MSKKTDEFGIDLPHWYCVNKLGMATLCASREDAEATALESDELFPKIAPHLVRTMQDAPQVARPVDEWREADGDVIWWALTGKTWNGELTWEAEAPWIGSPLWDDWPGYHTHWTPIPAQPTIKKDTK